MNRLSFELVEQIASHLDAGDALSLSTVCRSAREGCLSRLDPERYLHTTFKNARYLLAAMADYGCVLSGSRALEYFVPGSIEPDPGDAPGSSPHPPSDWDFLVPCVESSAVGMMDALAKCGVRWEHPLAEVFALIGKPAGSEANVRAISVYDVSPSHLESASLVPPSAEAMALYRQLVDFVIEEVDEVHLSWVNVEVVLKAAVPFQPQGVEYRLTEMMREDMLDNGMNPHTGRATDDDASAAESYAGYGDTMADRPIRLINGFIRPPGGGGERYKVQLFQCHQATGEACTPLEYIVNTYYATHVQCFISGWAAGHFYYDLARQRLALLWTISTEKQERAVQKCVQKYRPRGYRFFSADHVDSEFSASLSPVLHNAIEAPYPTPWNNSAVDQVLSDIQDLHIRPGAELQRQQQQPHPTDPLRAIRGGPLAPEGYAALRRGAEPVTAGYLGQAGTLLMRFGRLQYLMAHLPRLAPAVPLATVEDRFRDVRAHYRVLSKSLNRFRFALAKGRPTAVEPVVPALRRWGAADSTGWQDGSAPNLCHVLAQASTDDTLGNGGAPPNESGQFSPASPEWSYYRMLLHLTPTACSRNDCRGHVETLLPPQI